MFRLSCVSIGPNFNVIDAMLECENTVFICCICHVPRTRKQSGVTASRCGKSFHNWECTQVVHTQEKLITPKQAAYFYKVNRRANRCLTCQL